MTCCAQCKKNAKDNAGDNARNHARDNARDNVRDNGENKAKRVSFLVREDCFVSLRAWKQSCNSQYYMACFLFIP